jgi:NADPH-dependent 2,4-dienoyl-CoA reductase/sulfur reductase-like enzyme
MRFSRRHFTRSSVGLATATIGLPRPLRGQTRARVVVIGGGAGGATCARYLARDSEGALAVTLVEAQAHYTSCFYSNLYLAGWRDLASITHGYGGLEAAGVEVAHGRAIGVDPVAKSVRLEDGRTLAYDRLVVAAGIDLDYGSIAGYDAAAAEIMPHAWKAGAQTRLLRRQLEAMPDGGLFVIAAPPEPYRCPPGPYERASLIAHHLKTNKPRSKLIILDAKDAFSKQRLFEAAWQELYPGLIEWVPLSAGGRVTEVDPATKTLVTEFGSHKADVANVIPPQRAGAIAQVAGVADQTGWCPIDPVTFESPLRPGIHVVGDAAIGGAMPKSAFSANAQAKACAAAIAALLHEQQPAQPKLINTCYSLVAPDYGISIAGVYQPHDGLLAEVEGAGGVSPLDAARDVRELEAAYAEDWFRTITSEVFG